MIRLKRFAVGLVAFLAVSESYGQESNWQTWLDYTQQNRLNNHWKYIGDYGARWEYGDVNSSWKRLHARPGVSFQKKALYELNGGLLFSYTYSSEQTSFEFRPWQGVKLHWPNIKRVRMTQYLRTEQRQSWALNEDLSNFVFKLRYQIGARIPINDKVVSVKTFFVDLRYEWFFDLSIGNNEWVNDRIRLNFGLGYRLKPNLDLKIYYILQGNELRDEAKLDAENNIRISMVQRFGME